MEINLLDKRDVMDKNNFELIKQKLGNIVYSHKTHEKAIERKIRYLSFIKWGNIFLVGSILLILVLQLLFPKEKIFLYGGIGLTILEFIFVLIQLNFDFSRDIREHRIVANKLWLVREKYLNLLTDIKNDSLSDKKIMEIRNELDEKVSKIYENAPQTSPKDYNRAEKALNSNEKPKADDEELNAFLPNHLKEQQ